MKNPLTRRIHVKPVSPNQGLFPNIVFVGNTFESFADDVRRSGWRVAIANFFTELFLL